MKFNFAGRAGYHIFLAMDLRFRALPVQPLLLIFLEDRDFLELTSIYLHDKSRLVPKWRRFIIIIYLLSIFLSDFWAIIYLLSIFLSSKYLYTW